MSDSFIAETAGEILALLKELEVSFTNDTSELSCEDQIKLFVPSIKRYIQDYTKAEVDMKNQYEVMVKALGQLKNDFAAKGTEIEKLKKSHEQELKKQKDTNARLQKQVSELTREKASYQQDVAALQKENQALEQEKKKPILCCEFTDLEKKLMIREYDLKQAEENLQLREKEVKRQEAQLQKDIAEKGDTQTDQQALIAELTSKIEQLEAQSKHAEDKSNKKEEKKMIKLIEMVNGLQQQIKEYATKMGEKDLELQKKEGLAAESQAKISDLEQRIAELQDSEKGHQAQKQNTSCPLAVAFVLVGAAVAVAIAYLLSQQKNL